MSPPPSKENGYTQGASSSNPGKTIFVCHPLSLIWNVCCYGGDKIHHVRLDPISNFSASSSCVFFRHIYYLVFRHKSNITSAPSYYENFG